MLLTKSIKNSWIDRKVSFGWGQTYFVLSSIQHNHYYLTLVKKKSTTEQEHNAYQGELGIIAIIISGQSRYFFTSN